MFHPPLSERLRYRCYSSEDLTSLFSFYSHPEVTRFIPELHVTTLEEQEANLPRLLSTYQRYGKGFGVWAAESLETNSLVGTLLLKPIPDRTMQSTHLIEVGWHLNFDYWGQGYATEMGWAALHYAASERGIHEVVAVVSPENHGSAAVARRLGMKSEGLSMDFYGGEELLLFRKAL